MTAIWKGLVDNVAVNVSLLLPLERNKAIYLRQLLLRTCVTAAICESIWYRVVITYIALGISQQGLYGLQMESEVSSLSRKCLVGV